MLDFRIGVFGEGGGGARYFKPKLKDSNESVTAIINIEWNF